MCPAKNRFKVVEKRPIRKILNVELDIHGRALFLEKIGAAARSLAAGGYLLDGDVSRVVEHSAMEWDYLNGAP